MMILRKGHESKYTVIDNEPVRSSEMSLKAKGMLVTLLSFPDDWKFNLKGLRSYMTDGERSIVSALNELEDRGYLKREHPKRPDGTFSEWEWTVYESPLLRNAVVENAVLQNAVVQNAVLLSNEELSTDSLSTEKESSSSGKPDHSAEIAEIIAYLNSALGTSYKPRSKESVKHISARLDEGFTVSDFKAVIDSKVSQWGRDQKMREYLRPVTLFAPSKFEGYLQSARLKEVRANAYSEYD